MKRLITIFFLLISYFVNAQTAPPIVQGSKYYQFKNAVRIDSALFLPRGDTFISDNSLKAAGMLKYKTSDQSIWYYNGSYWTSLLPNSGNFIKNDTTNYQNAGFSVLLPSRISYTNDTTGNRYGALEVYRTIVNPDYKAPQNIRSVFNVYSTEAGHEDKELTGIYGGLHITGANTQNYTNATEGMIAVAGTASHLGSGSIALMSSFGALMGNAPANTGVITKGVFYKVTAYDVNSNPGRVSYLAGFAQPKLHPGSIANINWLSGIGDVATSGGMLGNAIWPSGNWNMYDASTYKSFHSGNLMVGDTAETTFPLRVAGKTKLVDTAYISKIVGGVLNTDNITLRNYSSSLSPVRIDSNGISAGTTSGISGTLLNLSKNYANHTSNIVAIRATPQAFERNATHTTGLIGATFQPIVTGSNNQSWNTAAIQGISVAPTISTGATGTFSNIYGETVTRTFNAASAIIDTFYYKRTYKSTETTPSTINNEIYDLVGVGVGIGGHWSRYDATTYPSYWGSGNQLINNNVDNGFGEKLQVSGRVDASPATRSSNLMTKGQGDSIAATKITNQQAIVETGNFNISGNGIANRFLAAAGTAGGAMTHYTMATTAFVNRFTFDLTGTESGSNSGSNWQLNRWADGGTSLGAALFVRRSDGFVGINTSTPNYRFSVGAGVMYGDGIGTSIVTKNTDNTASITNETVLNCTASITQTLPDAVSGNYGKIFVVNKDYSGGSVTIASNSIDGSPTYTLTDTLQSVTVISSGVSWRVVSNKISSLGFRHPTPTLTAVTTSGNTTGNSISVGGLITTGFLKPQLSVISSNITLSDAYTTVIGNTSSSARVLTLPTGGSYGGIMYFIKRSSSANTLTLNTSGSDAFDDGLTSKVISNAMIVQLQGSTWYILASY